MYIVIQPLCNQEPLWYRISLKKTSVILFQFADSSYLGFDAVIFLLLEGVCTSQLLITLPKIPERSFLRRKRLILTYIVEVHSQDLAASLVGCLVECGYRGTSAEEQAYGEL